MSVLPRALSLFEAGRPVEEAGQYIFHLPRRAKAHVGLGCHRRIAYGRDGFVVSADGGPISIPCAGDPLNQMRGLLDPGFPSFWMISPDLGRAVHDRDLPLILCVQPRFEVSIKGFGSHGQFERALAAEPAEDWQHQPDEEFLERLARGIAVLQDYPDGKMILTRSYQRAIGARDPLSLFAIFAGSEPASACNHYLQVDDGVASLGCSPENVFEVHEGRLSFDVVAATRGKSADPATDARWREALRNDPKERREHLLAFDRYKARIENLIEPGTLNIEFQLETLELGNVRHLYSRASGALRDDWDWMRILSDSFPALVSYPDALQPLADTQQDPLRYYGGILGRVSADGKDAAFFLNLRAALAKHGTLYTQGGVGVIAQSEPDKELLEVKNKLRGLFRAVAEWESGAV